jgi:hypothetical protein
MLPRIERPLSALSPKRRVDFGWSQGVDPSCRCVLTEGASPNHLRRRHEIRWVPRVLNSSGTVWAISEPILRCSDHAPSVARRNGCNFADPYLNEGKPVIP